MNIQDWFPSGLSSLVSLQSKGLSRVFSNTTVQKHQFFSAQLPFISLWNYPAHKNEPHHISRSAAAAAAKSLQSCPTLCDPTDGSPPGSPIPGILQARVLEWGATDKAGTASMQKPRGFQCPRIKIRVRVRVRVKPSAKAHVCAGCGVCFSLNKLTSYLSVTLSLTEFFVQ